MFDDVHVCSMVRGVIFKTINFLDVYKSRALSGTRFATTRNCLFGFPGVKNQIYGTA